MGVFVCAQVVPILCPSCAHADLADHDFDHWVDLANFTAMADSSRLIADGQFEAIKVRCGRNPSFMRRIHIGPMCSWSQSIGSDPPPTLVRTTAEGVRERPPLAYRLAEAHWWTRRWHGERAVPAVPDSLRGSRLAGLLSQPEIVESMWVKIVWTELRKVLSSHAAMDDDVAVGI